MNGVEFALLLSLALAAVVGVPRAQALLRREREPVRPSPASWDWRLARDLDLARAVRRSYDNLPYAGWRP